MGRAEPPGDPRGRVFDVQRFCVHDGPGIRTTVFFKGCPLRCEWCQNPESIAPGPQLMLYPDRCIGCGACAAVCSEMGRADAAAPPKGPAPRPVVCRACGRCVAVCSAGARSLAGRDVSLDDLLEEVLRDRPFYGARGGVTLSGGEPLAQWPFARALADRLRAEGVHVAMETACLAPRDVLADVPRRVDLVLADLKLASPEAHQARTGVAGQAVLEAIRLWAREMPGRLWISVPLVPGVHDEPEIARLADVVASLAGGPPVRLLPHHRLGNSKYAALGLAVPAFCPASDALVEQARQIFRSRGVRLLE
jgi:pyruvate formate lyase activating enzyme